MSPWSELEVRPDAMTDEEWKVTECKADDGHVVSLRIARSPLRIILEVVQPQSNAGGFGGTLKVRVDRQQAHEYACDGDDVVGRSMRRVALSIGPSRDEPPHSLLYDLYGATDKIVIRYQREDDGDNVDVMVDANGLNDFLRMFPSLWQER